MPLLILRVAFVLVAAGLGITFIRMGVVPPEDVMLNWGALVGMVTLAVGVIALDMLVRRKQLNVISAVYFGLIVGLFLAFIFGLALSPLYETFKLTPKLQSAVQLIIGLVLCYACISLLLQTKDDFRFVIPYVEFSREVKGLKPLILDTSVVIDGRIADVIETGALDGRLVMPKFAISELQGIADSSDRLKRGRGRRGLDILNRLRANKAVDFEIFDRELAEFANQPVDLKLVALAKHLSGKLVTNDFNLSKVAKLQGVPVINLNELANTLKPVFLPGEHFEVRVVKAGEEAGQGVGYLEDGTMVVIEGGREHVGQSIAITVTSVLQTSAGRMVFGKANSRA